MEVGIEDHQQVARGMREAEANSVALASSGLLQGQAAALRVGGDAAPDRLPGAVRRVSLDEDDFVPRPSSGVRAMIARCWPARCGPARRPTRGVGRGRGVGRATKKLVRARCRNGHSRVGQRLASGASRGIGSGSRISGQDLTSSKPARRRRFDRSSLRASSAAGWGRDHPSRDASRKGAPPQSRLYELRMTCVRGACTAARAAPALAARPTGR